MIFHNTKEKTSKVKFSELTVKKYTEDKFEEIGNEIVLIENKNDICDISDTLISEATKDEIVKILCSFSYNDFVFTFLTNLFFGQDNCKNLFSNDDFKQFTPIVSYWVYIINLKIPL